MISNIYKLYIIKLAKWFMLVMPIVVLFYESNGLSVRHVFILQAIYSVSVVVLEIPSGYMADVLGRKLTLISGAVLGFLGFLIYSCSYGFWGFLVAEVVLGIGQSFISGADSAMLYDSLKQDNREHEYAKYEGFTMSIGNFAEAIAGVAGGFLATISLRTPYIIQTVIAFFAIPAAIALVEPKKVTDSAMPGLKAIFRVVRYSLVESKELRYNIIVSSVIGCGTLTMAWFVQPFFIQINLPVKWYGVLWTMLNILVGITAIFAFRFDKRYGQIKLVTAIVIVISVCFALVGLIASYWALAVLILFYLLRGVATPVLKDYINRLCDSNIRATVLSVRNFVIRIMFSIIAPIVGWMCDAYSLSIALYLVAIVVIIVGGVSLVLLKRVLNSNN